MKFNNILCYMLLAYIGHWVPSCMGWQYFTNLEDIVLSNSMPEKTELHSEYHYGDCKREDKRMQVHTHLNHMDVLGKLIIRGWLKLTRLPICILLRARSHLADMFRNTAYNFQICTLLITYCHSHKRFKYYYYEWYIPKDYIGGMDWDIYFFVPRTDSY